MRRVLDVAPPSIREVFDDHKGLTERLRTGDADATARRSPSTRTGCGPRLAAFLAERPRTRLRHGGLMPRSILTCYFAVLDMRCSALHTTHMAQPLNRKDQHHV